MKPAIALAGLLSASVLATAIAPAFAETAQPQAAQSAAPRLEWQSKAGQPAARNEQRLAQAGNENTRPMMRHRPGEFADRRDGERRMERHAERGRKGDGPHGMRDHRFERFGMRDPELTMAGKLAVAETLIGIRSDQLDAWRTYTAALLDFVERPDHGPDGFGPGRRGPAPAAVAPAAATPPAAADDGETPLFAERMADMVIAKAEKAETLKDAAEALRQVLTPEQIDKLAEAERFAGPHHGPRMAMRHGFGPGGPGQAPQGPVED